MEFVGHMTKRNELLYLRARMRLGMVHWLVDIRATSNFISEVCAKVNVERILKDLTLVIELAEGSKCRWRREPKFAMPPTTAQAALGGPWHTLILRTSSLWHLPA